MAIFSRYLEGDPTVRSLFGIGDSLPAALKEAIERARKREIAPPVIESLRDTLKPYGATPRQQEHLSTLSQSDRVFVVTGQQVGLFGGPLLGFYKALSAMVLAEKISREYGVQAIPLFWLQAEDHDLREIAQFAFPDANGETVHLTSPVPDENRISVQYRTLEQNISELLERLSSDLAHFASAQEIIKILREQYVPGTSYVDAYLGTLHRLLGKDGLLFLRPRDPRVSTAASPIFQQALRDHKKIEELLSQRGEKLRSLGEEEQVRVIPDSPLFFVHPSTAEGARFRVRRTNNGWECIGNEKEIIPEQKLLEFVSSAPTQLSSSALLRPIIQDFLLPTAAYVGGPAEVGYFAQTASLYPLFNMSQPLVVLRARFALVEPKVAKFLDAIQLTVEEVTDLENEELIRRLVSREKQVAADVEKVRGDLNTTLAELEGRTAATLGAVDSTLDASTHRTFEKFKPSVTTLIERYEKALLNHQSLALERLKKARALLRPEGEEQERIFGAAYFLAKYGEHFTNVLKESMKDPLSGARTFLRL